MSELIGKEGEQNLLLVEGFDGWGLDFLGALDELEYCISESGEPDREVDRIVLTDILNRFLSGLSKDARIIFLQRYWYLLSIRDIAVNLGISESKVKTSLMRSRQRLKEMLKVEGIWV